MKTGKLGVLLAENWDQLWELRGLAVALQALGSSPLIVLGTVRNAAQKMCWDLLEGKHGFRLSICRGLFAQLDPKPFR